MINYAIYLSIIIFPIQVLSIRVSETSFDLTSVILAFIFFSTFFFREKKVNLALIAMLLFVSFQLILFIFSPAPITRFSSALFWIVLYFLFIYNESDLNLDYKLLENLLISILSISALYAWIEYFFLIEPENYNQGIKLRSHGFFSEPSYAGLAYYAAALSLLSKYFLIKQNKRYLIFFFYFFSTGILTLSLHIITFFISFLIIVYFLLNILNSKSLKILLIIFVLFTFMFGLFALIYPEFFEIFTDHFLSRINIFDKDTNSLSQLAWLRGFEQMVFSIKKTYIFGFGLGSTGEYYFPSYYGDKLNYWGLFNLTLKDGFSLFFRLVIEIGIFFTLVFLVYLYFRVKNFFNIFKFNKIELENYFFLFIFSLTVIIGSLIKEPNYARSSLCVALFIIGTMPLKRKYERKY